MAEVLRWKTVKTRKDYKCPLCGRIIPKCSDMVTAAWADGGSVFSERFCVPCEQYWTNQLNGEEISFERDSPIYGDDKETWDKIVKEIEN